MSNKTKKCIKWWLQYIFIPLVGSGGLISLFIAFNSPKQNPSQNTKIESSRVSIKQGVVGNISTKNGSVYIINEGLDAGKISKSKGLVPVASEREISGKSRFLKCDYGALAILSNAKTRTEAVNADTFLMLSSSKQNRMKVLNPPLWLQFNHHLSDTNGKRRHLGIMVVTFGNMGSIMPLEVYRNKKWIRPNNKQILGQFTEVVDSPWMEFIASARKWARPDAKIEDSDKIVKGPWQAIPEGGNKISWEFRKFWSLAADICQQTAKSVLGAEPNFDNVKVSWRLIGYNPTPLLISSSPVVFDIRSINRDNGSAFIAIYALQDSGQDEGHWYWITSERYQN